MHVQWLSWQYAMLLGLTFVGTTTTLTRTAAGDRQRSISVFTREAAVVAFLYGLWRIACNVSFSKGQGAFGRAHLIERIEHWTIPLSEHTMQRLVLGHPLAVRAADLYYAGMHFVTTIALLVWLFLAHRDDYPRARSVLGWSTLVCLVIQLVPVAPPRLLPNYVDTAVLYHQSVYSTITSVDELSAMPSMHVLWAAVVGLYVWRLGSGLWRYLGLAHLALTTFCVVVTANHWWLDAVVAVAIVFAADLGYRRLARRPAVRRSPDQEVILSMTGPTTLK